MKFNRSLFIALFIWCAMLCAVKPAVAQNQHRGIWVWSRSEDIIDDFNNNSSFVFEDFISFVEAPHGEATDRVVNIYMSCYTQMLSNPDHMRAFLADMNSRGFSVYVVLSDPDFVLPSEVIFFQDKIDKIILFQKKGNANERFAGIMLDIEPHLCTGLDWDDTEDRAVIWANYITELTYCRTEIDSYNSAYEPDMAFSDAIASWYSTSFIADVVAQVDFLTVQAYSHTKETIVAIASEEIAAAHAAGMECVVGVETMPLTNTDATFYGLGVTVFEEALDYLDTTYSTEPAFGGVAIHLYANADEGEEGYQNLTSPSSDDAPVIYITTPNGVQVEGISFENSVTIEWDVYNPDSKTYNVSLSYKYQSDLNNELVAWQSIHSLTNVSSTVTAGSYEWVTSLTTSPTDRIIIKADISYTSAPVLTTSDMTDFGIGINEIPVFNTWGDPIYTNYSGYPQGMQVIADSNYVLHATYYLFYDNSDFPGVYYAQSSDNGLNWTSTYLTPGTYSYDGGDLLSTWPRRPSMAKHDDVVAIAWIEASTQAVRTAGFTDNRVYLQINDNAGNSSDWMSAKVLVSSSISDIYSNVNVHVASDDSVHLIWESYEGSTGLSTIQYAKYTYNSGSGAWETTGVQAVDQSSSDDYVLRTPSVTTTSYGVHAIWSEYKKETTSLGSGTTIFDEDFESYPVNSQVTSGHSVSGLIWQAWGSDDAYIKEDLVPQNKFVKLYKNTTGTTSQFGFSHIAGFSFDPPIDLTAGSISFRIRTNLPSSIPDALSIQVTSTCVNAEDPDWVTTFRIYAAIPASSGWQTLTFDVDDLQHITWPNLIPRLTDVRKVEIYCPGGSYSLPNGQIDIDDFRAQGVGTTSVPPEVRIVTRTKTTTWQSAKEVATHTYTSEQLFNGVADNFLNYPVYFPKITSLGNYTYAVWQVTTLGTPNADGLAQYSSVEFSKRDVSSTSNNWDTATTLTTDGYAPVISAWNNSGTPTVQVVYSNNFAEYIADEAYTGNLLYNETTNQGASWAGETTLVQGSGVENGIRRPYINNSYSGIRAIHFMSYPFIFSDENGISIMNWINGGQNGSGMETSVPEEYYKLRGLASFSIPNPPFADLTPGGGFTISWNPPDIQYAPTGYKLRRIPDNNPAMAYDVNSGNPIYAISYYDNESIIGGVHYRYEMSYQVDGGSSPWSLLSNAIKEGTNLLVDDFEYDGASQTYTGMTYSFFTAYKPMTGVITSEQSVSGSNSYKITYNDNDTTVPQGALASLTFPTTMDFSAYGSLRFKVRFNPDAAMVERDFEIQLVEYDTGETFRIGEPVTLEDDGQWHAYNLFFDQASPEVNGVSGATLDLDRISQINIVTWGNDSTSFYIDDMVLAPTSSSDVILYLDTSSLTLTSPIQNTGAIKGQVVNQALVPVTVYFGNAGEPWVLSIYTAPEIKNSAQQVYPVTRNGLIRYDSSTDTVYPQYTMPVKVWCGNYGPAGFFSSPGVIANSTYAADGYPPIENDYFFKGYDFNGDGDIGGLLLESDGPFIEGSGAGEYPFDLDGDGYQQGDNFFDPADGRIAIGEEPAWLFIPVLQHDTEPASEGAIVMDPTDIDTWRVLTDSEKGTGTHFIELYFSIFIGEEQLLNASDPNAYGQYTNSIIIDLSYN